MHRADRYHRPPHGLRHDRYRARLRAGEIQEALRRRILQDHQPVDPARASQPRLQRKRRSTTSSATPTARASLYGAPYINVETLTRARLQRRRHLKPSNAACRPSSKSASASINGALGEPTLQRLGFTPEQYNAADFDLLPTARILARRDRRRQQLHLRHDDHRRRTASQRRALRRLRLRQQVRQDRPSVHPAHGPRPHDGGGAAVHLGRHLARPSTCPPRRRSRTSKKPTCARGISGSRRSRCIATAPSSRSRCRTRAPTNRATTADDRQLALSKEFEEQLAAARQARADELRPDEILAAAQRILANATNTDFKRKVAQALERNRLPAKRRGWTQKAKIAGHTVFLRTGEYGDGTLRRDLRRSAQRRRLVPQPDELLRHRGVDRTAVRRAARGVRREIHLHALRAERLRRSSEHQDCTSVIDYIFRVLGMEYLGRTDFVQVKPEDKDVDDTQHDDHAHAEFDAHVSRAAGRRRDRAPRHRRWAACRAGKAARPRRGRRGKAARSPARARTSTRSSPRNSMRYGHAKRRLASMMGDAPVCDGCGSLTRRNGACYVCDSCGRSMGCS